MTTVKSWKGPSPQVLWGKDADKDTWLVKEEGRGQKLPKGGSQLNTSPNREKVRRGES